MTRNAIVLLSYFILLLSPAMCHCDIPAPSDASVLSNMLANAVEAIMESSQGLIPQERKLNLEISEDFPLTSYARNALAAMLTKEGISISDSSTGCQMFKVSVTDARVVIRTSGKTLDRDISMTVHADWYDQEGSLAHSGKREMRVFDTIPQYLNKATNNSWRFSPNISRREIKKDRNTLKLATLAGITAILVFLAYD